MCVCFVYVLPPPTYDSRRSSMCFGNMHASRGHSTVVRVCSEEICFRVVFGVLELRPMVQIYLYLRIVRAKYDAENIFAQIHYGLQCCRRESVCDGYFTIYNKLNEIYFPSANTVISCERNREALFRPLFRFMFLNIIIAKGLVTGMSTKFKKNSDLTARQRNLTICICCAYNMISFMYILLP